MPDMSPAPLPTPLLYPLLKALDPSRAINGKFKAPKGMKVNAAAKRSFLSTLSAADQAKSPKQFASLMNGGDAVQDVRGWGAITQLTVEYQNGLTVITIRYEKGNMPIIVVYAN
jgi:hypothetical protein